MSQTLTATEWTERFAAELGASPPDEATTTLLLELAGVAAHSSERVAAPIACYLAGLTGADPAQALALARKFSTA